MSQFVTVFWVCSVQVEGRKAFKRHHGDNFNKTFRNTLLLQHVAQNVPLNTVKWTGQYKSLSSYLSEINKAPKMCAGQ